MCRAVVAALVLVETARAAEPEQPELLLFEDTPVVAATKYRQPLAQAPSDVTVVTREDIRRFGHRTLAEALRSVRGFYGTSDRNYDYIGVRGFLLPGDFNDRILLLVNGHTYNDDIYQTALLGNEFGIDLEAVERIEVVRGPGSALYGGNALFAVVNVVTATGAERPGVRPVVETGSFGRKRGQLSVGHVFEPGVDLFATGSVLDVEGHHELYYPDFDDPRTNFGIAHHDDGERAMSFFTRAQYHRLVLQGGANWREKHVPTGAYDTTFNDGGTKTTDSRRFADLSYAFQPAAGFEPTARLYYDGYRYHGTYVYGAGANRTKNEDWATSNWVGGELRARRPLPGGNVLTVGAEYSYHPRARQENYDLPGRIPLLDDARSFDAWGVYAQDEWRALDTLTFVAGLRFDGYYGGSVKEVSPRLAAIWAPRDGSVVKLLGGRAFRPPNLYERYYAFPSAGGGASLPNADLDAEHINTYEALLEQRLWQGARAVIGVYHYDVEDLIAQEPAASSAQAVQFRNGADARANGFSAELRTPLPARASLRAHYTLQQALSRGRRLANSPQHSGGAGLLFPLPLGFEGGAEFLVVGPRLTRGRRRLEAARLLNLNLEYRTPVPGLEIGAGLYNLLDHTHPDPAGLEFRQDRIPQDGRTFRLQLRYVF